MSEVKVYPVRPEDQYQWWPFLEKGMKKIIEREEPVCNPGLESIHKNFMSCCYHLWVFADDNPVGFLLTTPFRYEDDTMAILVAYFWAETGRGKECIACWDDIVDLCKQIWDVKRMCMKTPRSKAFARMLEPTGLVPVLTEYQVEV